MTPSRIWLVIPAWNDCAALERTLASVAAQAGDFELHFHVQDAGSTDDTVRLLERWEDIFLYGVLPRVNAGVIFTFESRPDEGPADAIAAGLQRAKAEARDWMGWIGAGDVLAPGALATLVTLDRSSPGGRANWVIGAAGGLDGDVIRLIQDRPMSSEVAREGLCDGRHWDMIQSAGAFFRASVWADIDPDRDVRAVPVAAGWNLWRRIAQRETLYQVETPLVFARPTMADGVAFAAEVERIVPADVRDRALGAICADAPQRQLLKYDPSRHQYVLETCSLAEAADRWGRARGLVSGPPSGEIKAPPPDQPATDLPQAFILAHDADWQFPAITEQHAYERACQLLPDTPGMVYLAFPWATLIDRVHNNVESQHALMTELETLAARVPPGSRVVTVCQHILAKRYLDLFQKAGVTDLFWSHAVRGEDRLGDGEGVRVCPFPLYPVQVPDLMPEFDRARRPYLFSFIGARANQWYLTQARNWLLDRLDGDSRGLIVGRDAWHYNRVVYDHQIRRAVDNAPELVDRDASNEFRQVLADSIFSLCPSGTGPNSIRLWEAIGAGSVPVIISDRWAPPGNEALWRAACVFCPETEAGVAALPERLEKIARDDARMQAMRQGLRQLWLLYGPDVFIHDIQALYLEQGLHTSAPDASGTASAGRKSGAPLRIHLYEYHSNRTPLSYEPYQQLARGQIEFVDRPEDADLLMTGFDVDFRRHAEEVRGFLDRNADLRLVVLSEEPLWDTVWSAESLLTDRYPLKLGDKTVECRAFNHFNTPIYDFDKIPYFLTSSDDYIRRYATLFRRNADIAPEALLKAWKNAPTCAAFYAEKRSGENYDFGHPEADLYGLSVYRTRVAEAADAPGVVRVGLGWSEAGRRQELPDWHLDKLAALDGRTRVTSGIENTHFAHYVTEKIFDAFAVRAIPLYYASPSHRIHEFVDEGAYLNLFGQSPAAAARLALDFEPDLVFAKAYHDAQRRLAALFSRADYLAAERRRILRAVVDALQNV